MEVLKELILTVSTLGGDGGLERTDFKFLLCKGVVILKILDLTISTLLGCTGLERTDFNISTLGGDAGLERTDFKSFYFARVL